MSPLLNYIPDFGLPKLKREPRPSNLETCHTRISTVESDYQISMLKLDLGFELLESIIETHDFALNPEIPKADGFGGLQYTMPAREVGTPQRIRIAKPTQFPRDRTSWNNQYLGSPQTLPSCLSLHSTHIRRQSW